MKQEVSYEEMNAAVLLLTGTPLGGINEIHIAPHGITTVYLAENEDGEPETRVHIGRLVIPAPPEPEDPEEDVPGDKPEEPADESTG